MTPFVRFGSCDPETCMHHAHLITTPWKATSSRARPLSTRPWQLLSNTFGMDTIWPCSITFITRGEFEIVSPL